MKTVFRLLFYSPRSDSQRVFFIQFFKQSKILTVSEERVVC